MSNMDLEALIVGSYYIYKLAKNNYYIFLLKLTKLVTNC